MSEDFESVVTEQSIASSISHRRILWTMAVITIAGAVAGSVFISPQFGAGVLLGGILSFVNYYWLKISLKRIFESAIEHGEKPSLLAVRYFSRYVALGVILLIIFLTKTIPVIAVVLGLASFALAIVVEGFIRLFSTFFKNRKI